MVRMAEENHAWGYGRIQGALSNLGHEVARTTIADILQRHGIEPARARNRKATWKEFLSRHWKLIVAADFLTVEVWTRSGQHRFMVLFFMEGLRGKCRSLVLSRWPTAIDEPDWQESDGWYRRSSKSGREAI